MELILNISLRNGRGQRVVPLTDLTINDLYAKMPEEVMTEILDRIDGPVQMAYSKLGAQAPGDWDD